MSEKRIDLNLLNVFYAVMLERSVTRAAQRLAMSQPAVSNALRRLRHLFQDQLFIKAPGGIRPTEKATMIWPELQDALGKIRAVTLPPEFAPASTRLTFNIAITDTLVSRVIPALATRFVREAPHARPHFHLHSNPGSTAALERGVLDCAVGMFPNPSPELQIEGLFSDEYVCIFRRKHKLLRNPLSLDAFVSAKHVLVKQATWQLGIVDTWLSLLGRQREIVMMVNSCADAIAVVRETDLTAAVPRGYVDNRVLAQRLEIAALPFDNEKILYKLAWHERNARDPAQVWLRQIIREAVIHACSARSDAPQFAKPVRASGRTAVLTSRRRKIAGSRKGWEE
jgi:DNA-binding transcriptional LysR family regulator